MMNRKFYFRIKNIKTGKTKVIQALELTAERTRKSLYDHMVKHDMTEDYLIDANVTSEYREKFGEEQSDD